LEALEALEANFGYKYRYTRKAILGAQAQVQKKVKEQRETRSFSDAKTFFNASTNKLTRELS